MKNIGVIGGGAAGYFAAINIMEMMPSCKVTIYERASKPLAKVAVSGGGRCNLTNSFNEISNLKDAYPRGHKAIKQLFKYFDNTSCVEWFESREVKLVCQDDQCYFPEKQDSAEIINTFRQLCKKYGVTEKMHSNIQKIEPCQGGGYNIVIEGSSQPTFHNAVVVTTGGSPTLRGLSMLEGLDLQIEHPAPSLFTFNIKDVELRELMGAVVNNVILTLKGTKLRSQGILLITHWGLSGPAALKLSSYGARVLQEKQYNATISVNWVAERNEEVVREQLKSDFERNKARLITNIRPFGLPLRVWEMLLTRAGISHERRMGEVGSKGLSRLVNVLCNDEYAICGKSKFREEFVTCGGVALNNINIPSMEAKQYSGLYFAGEVLDVDAITGGFNLQAAWSMGYCAALAITSVK